LAAAARSASSATLHILDARAPWTVWRAAELTLRRLRSEEGARAHLLAAPSAAALRRGLAVDAPLGRTPATAALRLAGEARRIDAVHLWWEGACDAALRLALRGVRRTATLWAPPDADRQAQEVARWATHGAVAVGGEVARRWPGLRVRTAAPPVLLEPAEAAFAARLRRLWGASKGTAVVGLAGEPAEDLDALRFASALGALALLGVRALGVVPAAAQRIEHAHSMLLALRSGAALRVARCGAQTWLGACDAALGLGRDVAAAQAALDAGVAVAAPAPLADDLPGCCRAAGDSPILLAGALRRALAQRPPEATQRQERTRRAQRWTETHRAMWPSHTAARGR